jgi:hypothetical protein
MRCGIRSKRIAQEEEGKSACDQIIGRQRGRGNLFQTNRTNQSSLRLLRRP